MCCSYDSTGNASEAQRPYRHRGTRITIPGTDRPPHETEGCALPSCECHVVILGANGTPQRSTRSRRGGRCKRVDGGLQRVILSVQSPKIFGQLYPTRRKAVWSQLLSLKNPAGRQLHARPSRSHRNEALGRGSRFTRRFSFAACLCNTSSLAPEPGQHFHQQSLHDRAQEGALS